MAQTPPRCDTEWLLQMLKEDGYWLRAHKAKRICKKLGVTFTCEAYYTDSACGCHSWCSALILLILAVALAVDPDDVDTLNNLALLIRSRAGVRRRIRTM